MAKLGSLPTLIVLDEVGGGEALKRALDELDAEAGIPATRSIAFGAGRSCLYSIHLRLDRYP